MKVSVLQSNYLPWKGYFDIIYSSDLFIFYDDIQFTKNDWRNRNKIKTQTGPAWLTIPVGGDLNRLINEVTFQDQRWAKKHWKSIQQYYSRAPFFKHYQDFLEDIYLNRQWSHLSELNQYLIRHIASQFLGIKTEFRDSREFETQGKKQDRLMGLLKQVGASSYISGPSAQNYIDEKEFEQAGIQLSYISYSGYPEYPQFFPPFSHQVFILDLLFHTGPDAPRYIWGERKI
jgi:hypothetical protein